MSSASTAQQIGRQDLRRWDGITPTYTRRTSTGGALTLNKVGNTVCLSTYGTVADDSTLSSAIQLIGSRPAILELFPGTWAINNTVTVPRNMILFAPPGAYINIASGKTLTASLEAAPHKIFHASSTGTFVQTASVAFPEWWGAIADGATDCTDAIQEALDSDAPITILQNGTYLTTGNTYDTQQVLMGYGYSSILKMNANDGFVLARDNTDEAKSFLYNQFRDFTVDMNKKGCAGLWLENLWHAKVTNVQVLNVPYGTFSYDDKSTLGSQTYSRCGVALKGTYGLAGTFYNCLDQVTICGGASRTDNTAGNGSVGILLTSTTPTSSSKANFNLLTQCLTVFMNTGIHVERGNDNSIYMPETTWCYWGIKNQGTRTWISGQYAEQCRYGPVLLGHDEYAYTGKTVTVVAADKTMKLSTGEWGADLKIQKGSIIQTTGFATAGNNGVFFVTSISTDTATLADAVGLADVTSDTGVAINAWVPCQDCRVESFRSTSLSGQQTGYVSSMLSLRSRTEAFLPGETIKEYTTSGYTTPTGAEGILRGWVRQPGYFETLAVTEIGATAFSSAKYIQGETSGARGIMGRSPSTMRVASNSDSNMIWDFQAGESAIIDTSLLGVNEVISQDSASSYDMVIGFRGTGTTKALALQTYNASQVLVDRLRIGTGTDVASIAVQPNTTWDWSTINDAATVQSLVLTAGSNALPDGKVFAVTAAAPVTVTHLTTPTDGREITLIFKDNNVTLDQTGNLNLASPFVSEGATNGYDVLKLIAYNGGTNLWHEISRSMN